MKEIKTISWSIRVQGCGLMILVFLLLPLAGLIGFGLLDRHPSDEEMQREFREQRASFDALLGMMREEKRVTRIGSDFVWIDDAHHVLPSDRANFLSDERLARYRALFRTLKLESGIIRYGENAIGFIRSSEGYITSGSSKEFLWAPQLASDEAIAASDARDLEDVCIPKSGCQADRRISPGWYISFESH